MLGFLRNVQSVDSHGQSFLSNSCGAVRVMAYRGARQIFALVTIDPLFRPAASSLLCGSLERLVKLQTRDEDANEKKAKARGRLSPRAFKWDWEFATLSFPAAGLYAR